MTPDRVPTPQPDLLSPSPANAPPVEVLPAEALQTLYYAPVEVRQQVRMLVRNEEPWWVANDICARLGLSNPRKAVGDLDEDEKGVTTGDTLGGPQEMLIINESGLYSLILRSRKPEAKAFKRWVTHEVLPTLRRTGSYGGGFFPGGGRQSAAGSSHRRFRPLELRPGADLPRRRAATVCLNAWRLLVAKRDGSWFHVFDFPFSVSTVYRWLADLERMGVRFARPGRGVGGMYRIEFVPPTLAIPDLPAPPVWPEVLATSPEVSHE